MIKSMTAFGSADTQQGDTRYIAEVRSLNHRHRDIVVRLGRNHQSLEEGIRTLISSRIRRGRIEASFQMEKTGDALPYDVALNVPLADAYLKAFRQLAAHAGMEPDIPLESLLNVKDMILMKPETVDTETLGHGLHQALNQALDALDAMRTREGRRFWPILSNDSIAWKRT